MQVELLQTSASGSSVTASVVGKVSVVVTAGSVVAGSVDVATPMVVVASRMTSSGLLTATTIRPTSNPIDNKAPRELITVNVFSKDVLWLHQLFLSLETKLI